MKFRRSVSFAFLVIVLSANSWAQNAPGKPKRGCPRMGSPNSVENLLEDDGQIQPFKLRDSLRNDHGLSFSLDHSALGFAARLSARTSFLRTKPLTQTFTSGNFEYGAQASAVAITAGANASAGAGSAQSRNVYTNGMAIFTHAKGGLMYEAAIGGQKFSFDEL